ncbi:MAG: amidohydrolase [Chloroflexi bacterium]|nr:amidohydrolase [Chloroflexota bacterium]
MNADMILRNGRIFTVDSSLPWAEAVACDHGRIMAVGTFDELKKLAGPDTKIINANGRLVLPGLIDAHVHFLWYVLRQHNNQIDLYGVNTIHEMQQRIQKAVQLRGEYQWLHGWGWDETHWAEKPSLRLLDGISSDIPLILHRADLHTVWVNSAALKLAGITHETPDPAGGKFGRDETGLLTGVLHEWAAIELVEKHIPGYDHQTLQNWLKDAMTEANELGLTSIHDIRLQREGPQSLRLFNDLYQQGELNLRIHMNIAAEFLNEAVQLGIGPGFGNEHLWLGQVKVFADGSMGGKTALMLEPFEKDPGKLGISVTSPETMHELGILARQVGFSLSVHAIGDRAVRNVIDVMSEIPEHDRFPAAALPHRIEHVQLIHPDDLPRLSRHHIIASVQPVHILTDWKTANRVWGARARYAYAFRSMLDHHVQLAFGSDAPFADLNPMMGIYAAVTRCDGQREPEKGWYPEERLSVAESIHGYTMGAAIAAGKGSIQGSISPGKWADFILLNKNIFEIDPMEIPDAKVVMTVVNGRVVFESTV